MSASPAAHNQVALEDVEAAPYEEGAGGLFPAGTQILVVVGVVGRSAAVAARRSFPGRTLRPGRAALCGRNGARRVRGSRARLRCGRYLRGGFIARRLCRRSVAFGRLRAVFGFDAV